MKSAFNIPDSDSVYNLFYGGGAVGDLPQLDATLTDAELDDFYLDMNTLFPSKNIHIAIGPGDMTPKNL